MNALSKQSKEKIGENVTSRVPNVKNVAVILEVDLRHRPSR
jgi:hypothetical protein